MAALTAGLLASAMIGGGIGMAIRNSGNKDKKAGATVWKRGPTAPVMELPEPINQAEESAAAAQAATRARMKQRRSAAGRGRSATLLTDPDLLGTATVQRSTLLGG